MSKYVAFLRGINAGAGRSVKMKTIRQIFLSLDFSNVTTVAASGNVLFQTAPVDTRMIEIKIESGLREALGFVVAAFVRTNTELAEIAQLAPFTHAGVDSAPGFYIIFLADVPDGTHAQKLMSLNTDTDRFHLNGREIYWLRRKKPGTLTYSTPPLDKALGKPFTIRSAKIVKKVIEKYTVLP